MQPNNAMDALPARISAALANLNARPLAVFLVSLGGALLYTAWITWRFNGTGMGNQFVYVVPIVVPFVAFLLDRSERVGVWKAAVFIIDFVVVATAMMRVIGNVPFVSGHTLFLSYAIVGPASKVTRITAALVMVEVIYLKYFVWHDFVTSSIGILLGTISALITRWLVGGVKG